MADEEGAVSADGAIAKTMGAEEWRPQKRDRGYEGTESERKIFVMYGWSERYFLSCIKMQGCGRAEDEAGQKSDDTRSSIIGPWLRLRDISEKLDF